MNLYIRSELREWHIAVVLKYFNSPLTDVLMVVLHLDVYKACAAVSCSVKYTLNRRYGDGVPI